MLLGFGKGLEELSSLSLRPTNIMELHYTPLDADRCVRRFALLQALTLVFFPLPPKSSGSIAVAGHAGGIYSTTSRVRGDLGNAAKSERLSFPFIVH